MISLAVSYGCATQAGPGGEASFIELKTPKTNDLSQARLIDESSYTSTTGDETFRVCTPPRPMIYGEKDASYVVLRMAPYRACQGVTHGEISRKAYQAFFEEYFDLLLLVTSMKSLTQLERDTTTATHRETIEAFAAENAALKLMCSHPGLFAVDAGALDLCISGLLNKEVSMKNHEGRTD